ncbi:hypothetical protein [Paraburkholderia sp. DHOC27]|uniref:hypothetical protein n=1 Tax=Paraburkholderia sp. DHOC27 TaxID=2303330 RepID=UPI000E3D4FD4|nr:hypothetical protein [Paraburkholderia sp. DHOC27]RFU48152.1 hypothetical protein D0B32_11685 [Paraburkholderia sp. DHOC27]
MNEPRIKKPTDKTFHFPKSAKTVSVADEKKAAAPANGTVSEKASAEPKASRRKAVAKVETGAKAAQKAAPKAASKAAPAAKEKTAAKTKPAAKPQAVAKEKTATKKAAAPKTAAAVKKPAAPKKAAASANEAATPKLKRAKKEVEKKEKVVRDSFTMPKSDYAKIATLKQKCLDAGVSVKKSEVLRAGLLLLEGASLDNLLTAIAAVETVKTGRPSKE